ncbi:MAG: hypothetical protein RSD41_04630 [Kiritimatiellia bacterium]
MVKRFLFCAGLMGASFAFAIEGVSDVSAKLFGKEEGKRTTSGVVFVDGLFLKAPYVVSREGNVILVNGRVASRFKVAPAASADKGSSEKAAADAKAAAEDPAASGGRVSDRDGATIGSDDAPELKDTPAPRIAPATPKGSAIDAKLAAQKKSKAVKEQAAKDRGFNTEPTSTDPTALFEEADYTYTPTRKPEPKAIPYVRPAAQKSMKERAADAKATDVAQAARQGAKPDEEDEEDDGSSATEDFDLLSEEEIAAYKVKFEKRRAAIESRLMADGMVFLSSNSSAAKVYNKSVAQAFLITLPSGFKAVDAKTLMGRNSRMPQGYLELIFNNRAANIKEMTSLFSRIKRERADAAKRRSGRIQ